MKNKDACRLPSRVAVRAVKSAPLVERLECRELLATTPVPVLMQTVAPERDGTSLLVGNLASGATVFQRRTQTGAVDPTFGISGTLKLSQINNPASAFPDAQGRVVMLTQQAVYRVLADGSIDTAFAHGTGATVARASRHQRFSPSAAITAPNGTIYVFGTVLSKQHVFYDAVEAFQSDGRVSQGFGSSGLAIGAETAAYGGVGVTIDSRNRPLLLGGDRVDRQIQRFTAGGALDASFGDQGVVTIKGRGAGHRSTAFSDIAVSKDGEIFAVSGDSYYAASGREPVTVAAFNNDGKPDVHFGVGGFVIQPASRASYSIFETNIVTDGDGLLVSGFIARYARPSAAFIERLNPDGTVDTHYGSHRGFEVFNTAATDESDVLLGLSAAPPLDDGSRIIPLFNLVYGVGPSAVRISAKGRLDRTFGTDGYVTLALEPQIPAYRDLWHRPMGFSHSA